MAVIPIKVFPAPVLRKKAKKVGIIDRSTLKLIDDMIDTMHSAHGAGLAAPQVGVSLRVIVAAEPDEEPVCLINPEIVRKGEEAVMEEGCLSIPGYRGELKRCVSVTVKGLDRRRKPVRVKAEGLLAQALQHEIDHLNGVLFIDLVSPDKLKKIEPEPQPEAEAASSG
ncbi:MAG: peptide deformylase [Chloroflexi bacterium]|nr:peptide deformylase [Chloroflexota bacterium]